MWLGFLILGIIAISIATLGVSFIVFIVPKVFKEFKLITKLYYTMQIKEALTRHTAHFLLYLFFSIFILWIAILKESSMLYLVLLILFLSSTFIGFYIFLFFIYAIIDGDLKKIFLSILLGGAVFIIFVPTAYYVFSPIYSYMNSKKYKESRTYDKCHDKEDWLVGGECTSRDLTINDVVGRWQMQKNRDIKGSYEKYYFNLKFDGSVTFHSYFVAPQGSGNGYDYIDYIEMNSTWSFYLKGKGLISSSFNDDERHPYILIEREKAQPILFRFDSRYGDNLYLQNQYNDFDAPYYLTYKLMKTEDEIE